MHEYIQHEMKNKLLYLVFLRNMTTIFKFLWNIPISSFALRVTVSHLIKTQTETKGYSFDGGGGSFIKKRPMK